MGVGRWAWDRQDPSNKMKDRRQRVFTIPPPTHAPKPNTTTQTPNTGPHPRRRRHQPPRRAGRGRAPALRQAALHPPSRRGGPSCPRPAAPAQEQPRAPGAGDPGGGGPHGGVLWRGHQGALHGGGHGAGGWCWMLGIWVECGCGWINWIWAG